MAGHFKISPKLSKMHLQNFHWAHQLWISSWNIPEMHLRNKKKNPTYRTSLRMTYVACVLGASGYASLKTERHFSIFALCLKNIYDALKNTQNLYDTLLIKKIHYTIMSQKLRVHLNMFKWDIRPVWMRYMVGLNEF